MYYILSCAKVTSSLKSNYWKLFLKEVIWIYLWVPTKSLAAELFQDFESINRIALMILRESVCWLVGLPFYSTLKYDKTFKWTAMSIYNAWRIKANDFVDLFILPIKTFTPNQISHHLLDELASFGQICMMSWSFLVYSPFIWAFWWVYTFL